MIWQYFLNNNQTGKKEISDPLIDSEEIASQRANAEFLDGGYLKRYLKLVTHRTDVVVGDVVRVEGFCYLVTSASVRYTAGAVVCDIEGVRYE